MKKYTIYSLPSYAITPTKVKAEEYTIEELEKILSENDKSYHMRVKKDGVYKFFGDCDNYKKGINDFCDILAEFLEKYYAININYDDIFYTKNKSKQGSYHYVIPKFHASCKKLKEIHTNLLSLYEDEFVYENEKEKPVKVIDTTIYSNKWFRLPNQTKEGVKKTEHVIKDGVMKDFICEYIEKDSICIDDFPFLKQNVKKSNVKKKINKKGTKVEEKENTTKDKDVDKKDTDIKKKENTTKDKEKDNDVNKKDTGVKKKERTEKEDNVVNSIIKKIEWTLFIKFFDECYKFKRFSSYDYWVNVCMAIKNRYGEDGFELFVYFSNKLLDFETNEKVDDIDKLRKKYNSFYKDVENPITIATLYHYAKEDNKEKFIEIIKNFSPFKQAEFTSADIAEYIEILKKNDFIWKDNILYCFNGKYWEPSEVLMRTYIIKELHPFLKNIVETCFFDSKIYNKISKSVEKLRTLPFVKEVVEMTKSYLTNDKIEFDLKYNLFGFNNVVYDLKTGEFRDFRYDDFISITTGYDWIDPTKEEIKQVEEIIFSIMPDKDARLLYLEIFSTGLEGRCLEKIIIFSGGGRNGKGLMNDLYLRALGNFGLTANNAILFEKNKTGSNPERNKINKKRYVVFREPPAKNKLENSVLKELTGGGSFSARGHHESDTEKKLHMTMVIECNKKPLFAEEPQKADILRLIDLHHKCTFTDVKEDLDKDKFIFLANKEYKTEEFQNKHRCALLHILFQTYKTYKERDYTFIIPKSVENRTREYLELSCDITGWMKENYKKTTSSSDIIHLKEVFNIFNNSSYFSHFSNKDKKKYSKKINFYMYFSESGFYQQYYIEKTNNCRNILTNHVRINCDSSDEEENNEEEDNENNISKKNNKNNN